jgi:hypothetical protein
MLSGKFSRLGNVILSLGTLETEAVAKSDTNSISGHKKKTKKKKKQKKSGSFAQNE